MIGVARALANAVMDSAFPKSMYAIVFHTAKIALMRTQLSAEVRVIDFYLIGNIAFVWGQQAFADAFFQNPDETFGRHSNYGSQLTYRSAF